MPEKTISIGVVDDHTLIRGGVIALIRSYAEMNVVIDADNGKDFLQKIDKAKRKPDVCLVDINMPGMNGFEVVDAIKSTWTDIKIIAVSMHENDFSIIKMLQKGANGYLAKCEEAHELYKAIVDVHFTGYYHSNSISPRMLHRLLNNQRDALPKISDDEMRFLTLCSTEMTYKEIAGEMNITPRAVEAHRCSLFEKLDVKSRVGLVLYALKIGLITIT